MEKLNLFFNRIKEISFWQRIFFWGRIRALSYDAFKEFNQLEKEHSDYRNELDEHKAKCKDLEHDKERISDSLKASETTIIKQESTIERHAGKNDELNQEVKRVTSDLTRYESAEEGRKKDHQKGLDQMLQAKQGFEDECKELTEERLREKEEEMELMKRQWSNHEEAVKSRIKGLCQTHIIRYVDKVPFTGRPDNTIGICGEYIIFDAKSPATDDLSNFPSYLKSQAEGAKKYTKQENVKKDVFLIVPANTADCISQWSYNLGDYDVYVLTPDAMEPVILGLKKLEDYEFVDQLSPEERDNICRIIGKFAHNTKRRLQVEQFLANNDLDLLRKCETDLPSDFKKAVLEFEKAEKLNPPTEKRSKQILLNDLTEQHHSITAEALGRKVQIPANFEEVKGLD